MNEQSTQEPILCDGCNSVPVSHLALEAGVSEPLQGWQGVFDEMNIRTVVDPAGRTAIPTIAARRLLTALRRRDELFAEDAQRRAEKMATRHPVTADAVPAQEGMSPFESLAAAAGGVVSVEQEFGRGYGKPDFLREELAAGQRADDEKKRLAVERKQQRLLDRAKDSCGEADDSLHGDAYQPSQTLEGGGGVAGDARADDLRLRCSRRERPASSGDSGGVARWEVAHLDHRHERRPACDRDAPR